MKNKLAALLIATALLLPTTVNANTQVYKDVTVASQNEILKKISSAGIMDATMGNYFEPSKIVTRGEVASFIQNAYKLYNVRPAKEFIDVPTTHEHSAAIQALYRAGIIDGVTSTTFNPDGAVKRTHVAKIFSNLYKLTPQHTTKFKDVASTDAHNGFIGALVQKGIIAGYPDDTFRPNQAVTRMNMATFIYRGLYGKEPQIQNQKITSNSPYAATRLAAANYNFNDNQMYMRFDKNGNTIYDNSGLSQQFDHNSVMVGLMFSDFFLVDIDLRGLVEFKPQTRYDYLSYDEFFNYYTELENPQPTRYTLTPYFNQQVRINGTTYTDVLKVVEDIADNRFSDRIHYFKPGFGLIMQEIDGEIVWSIRSYKLK